MTGISLILLPGLDGTGELFTPFIEHLPEHIHPIVVSYPRDKPYGYKELVPLVLSYLSREDNFLILGESFSGPLAVKIAHLNPKGLKGLILCASFIKNPFRFLPSWLSIFSISPIYYFWPAAIILRAPLSKNAEKDLIKRGLKAVKSVKPKVVAGRVKSILKVNVEKELEGCKVPILYIKSEKDHLVKEHNLINIQSIKNDVVVSEIDTKHFVLQLEPKRAVEEIVKFIKQINSINGVGAVQPFDNME